MHKILTMVAAIGLLALAVVTFVAWLLAITVLGLVHPVLGAIGILASSALAARPSDRVRQPRALGPRKIRG